MKKQRGNILQGEPKFIYSENETGKKMKQRKVTRINEDLAKWLAEESKRTGLSESVIISVALSQYKERK